MYDYVVVLDEVLRCPHDHQVGGFQTKSFDDPSRRHAISPVALPGEIVFYTTCGECAPVLVRTDYPRAWGDLVDERRLWVEFRATFSTGQARRIECTSGTRDDLVAELREEGLRVMRDNEPLAIAHREVCAARDASSSRMRRR